MTPTPSPDAVSPPLHDPYRPAPLVAPMPHVSVLAAFKYVFAGEAPLATVLLLSLVLLIPVVGPIFVYGVMAATAQRLARGERGPMPRVRAEHLSSLLARGAPSFVAELIAMFGILAPAMVVAVPSILVVARPDPPSPVLPMLLFSVLGLAFFALFVSVWNAVVTRAALTEDIAASLRWRPLVAYVRRTWRTWLVAYLVFCLVTTGLAAIGTLACGLGCIPAMVVSQLALGHLRWQIYEVQRATGGAEIAVKGATGVV